jgi:hypothetical protein
MTSSAEMLKRAYRILPGDSLGSFYRPEGREYLDFVLGSGPRARS